MTSSASADKRPFDVHSAENPSQLRGLRSLKLVLPYGQSSRHGGGRYKNSEAAYHRLKSRLLRERWVPGQLLQIGMLAAELGTSTTPVREALVRLATERLIAYRPKRGFLVKTLTEEELRGLYFVNRMHLQTALCCWQERASTVPNTKLPGATQLLPTRVDEAKDLADATAGLILQIAAQSGIEEITAMVSNINDRLHRARIAEQFVLVDRTAQELRAMDTLYAAANHEKLKEAIRCYHEVRLQLVPSICKELLSMAFTDR